MNFPYISDTHPEPRFPAPSSWRKDVVNQCLEFVFDIVTWGTRDVHSGTCTAMDWELHTAIV